MTNFNTWWNNEGSGIRPLPDEDTEEFAKRITEIAWSNGAALVQPHLHKLTEELAFHLAVAVCYVEDAVHDESYKPERVNKQLAGMKSALEKVEVQNV
jgi:hypothetical protein